jgi:hypothetical protein
LLLAVCLDQTLDEFVDVARLRQVAPAQHVAPLGLGQALVALAGLAWSRSALTGLACQFLPGLLNLLRLLAGGLLDLPGLLMHEATG